MNKTIVKGLVQLKKGVVFAGLLFPACMHAQNTMVIAAGPSFPIGVYSNKNAGSSSSGLANTGETVSISYTHSIKKQIGIAATLQLQRNPISTKAFTDQFFGFFTPLLVLRQSFAHSRPTTQMRNESSLASIIHYIQLLVQPHTKACRNTNNGVKNSSLSCCDLWNLCDALHRAWNKPEGKDPRWKLNQLIFIFIYQLTLMFKKIPCFIIPVFVLLFSCSSKHEAYTKFLNKDSLPSQFVTIDNNKDTVLQTANGAILNIQKGSFTSDHVRLQVKEAYSIEQMVLAGLTTESDESH